MTQASLDPASIEEVRQRADIVDIISQYVHLKRTGHNYKGLCPFHSEKTPSFQVSADKQIYKCFGCGAGGNVFTFLMNYTNQSFIQVVKDLAQATGVRLVFSETIEAEEQFRNTLRRMNQEACQYFEWVLHHPQQGEEGRAYLQSRKISESMQKRFQVGYALNAWHALHDHLRSKGFSREELEKSGLFGQGKEGLYDLYRQRLIFPIVSVNSEVLGFGGRALAADVQAKYINSPETEIYQKGQHVYALNLAKKAIRERDQVLLMEGYLDVITAHQFGFEHAVAGLGTALTQAQARQVLRFTDNKQIVMCYDADKAGQKATDRGADVLAEVTTGMALQVRVMGIPDQEDPDTFLHQYGAEAFAQVLADAKPLVEYRLDKALVGFSLDSTLDKALAAKAAIAVLKTVYEPVYRDECIRQVAARLHVDEGVLREQLTQEIRKQSKNSGKTRFKNEARFSHSQSPSQAPLAASAFISRDPRDKLYGSELGLLYLMLQYPEHRGRVVTEVQDLVFSDGLHEYLRQYLVDLHGQGYGFEWQQLFTVFPEAEVHQRLVEMMESEHLKGLEIEKSLADFVRNVKLECLNRQISLLSQQIQAAEAEQDQEAYLLLMKDYMEQMKVLAQLRQIGL
ncbi:MAG: DNA primase [Candidatus Sericytochromatia bacterium]|nr:DNA primase [Candidatus Sericytochromatia bacterium]